MSELDPAPPGRFAITGTMAELRALIRSLPPGRWRDVNARQQYLLLAASQMRIKIKTRKLGGGIYRVWRLG